MKNKQKENIAKEFEKRLMSELFKVYAEYMTEVETPEEWDEAELLFKTYHQFIKNPKYGELILGATRCYKKQSEVPDSL